MAGKSAHGGRSSASAGKEKGCEQTTGRRRRESPLLLISSAFLPSSRSPSLYRCRRHPPYFASRHSTSSRYASSLARVLTLTLKSRLVAISLSHCGPPYSLRPFNSIATPFYNAGAPCSENGSHDSSQRLLTRRRESYMNSIPFYLNIADACNANFMDFTSNIVVH